MKIELRMPGEVTEDGQLLVELPPEVPHGRVVVTLELVPDDDLELTEDDLRGEGLTAEEISRSPEIGAWSNDPSVPSGDEYVERVRHASTRYSW